jgi:solute carrier family 25 oxoglutarate transporter 11
VLCCAQAGTLFRGLTPNIFRGMAMTAGQLAVYDEAKEALLKVTGDDPKNPGMATRAGASASGAICCAYASLPPDMLKSRLQNMKPGPDGVMPYSGMLDCFTSVVKNEGILALWTGHIAYAGRCVPHAMILLLVREPITDFWKKNVVGEQ